MLYLCGHRADWAVCHTGADCHVETSYSKNAEKQWTSEMKMWFLPAVYHCHTVIKLKNVLSWVLVTGISFAQLLFSSMWPRLCSGDSSALGCDLDDTTMYGVLLDILSHKSGHIHNSCEFILSLIHTCDLRKKYSKTNKQRKKRGLGLACRHCVIYQSHESL